jgi:hypothetical protein
MLSRFSKSFIISALAVSAIAGCKSTDTTVTPDTASSTSKVQFSYAGDRSGSFKITGAYPSTKEGGGVSSTLTADKTVMVLKAISYQSASVTDQFVITLTSSNAIAENQAFTLTSASSNANGSLVLSGPEIPAPSEMYTATSLNVVLTTVKSDQLKGSFSGTFTKGGASITVTDGQFDVKY